MPKPFDLDVIWILYLKIANTVRLFIKLNLPLSISHHLQKKHTHGLTKIKSNGNRYSIGLRYSQSVYLYLIFDACLKQKKKSPKSKVYSTLEILETFIPHTTLDSSSMAGGGRVICRVRVKAKFCVENIPVVFPFFSNFKHTTHTHSPMNSSNDAIWKNRTVYDMRCWKQCYREEKKKTKTKTKQEILNMLNRL